MKRDLASPRSAIPRWIWVGALAMWAQAGELARAGTGEPARVSDTVAMQNEVDAFENAFTNTLRKLDQHGASKSSATSEVVWGLVGLGLIGAIVMVKYVPRFLEFRDASYQARLAAAKAAVQVHPEMAAEEKAFEIFAENFNTGPAKSRTEPVIEIVINEAPGGREKETPRLETRRDSEEPKPALVPAATAAENGAIKPESQGGPATHVPALRKLVSELSKAATEPEKVEALTRLSAEVEAFKTSTEAPDWLPAWKVGSALEALLKQLAGKAHSVNASTLRTSTAAVDLLETLCGPGIRPDLLEQPPIRVLAVDDEPISRHALSFTLKKTLCLPELASNGATALELASQNTYDAIFLDVEMPELDGFQLCAKIRETDLNRKSPVVFVTRHTDFNSRAKSARAGGQDLIGKPFLTFELGLKALTLVLQQRLAQDKQEEPKETEEMELAAAGK